MFTKRGISKEELRSRIIEVLESKGLEYRVDPEGKYLIVPHMGDDLPITLFMILSEGTVEFKCKLAFEATEENFQTIIEAVNRLNSQIAMGAFVVDTDNGWITYRYSYIYIDVRPKKELLWSLIEMALNTVDEHDGALKAIMPIKRDDDYMMMFV